MGIGGMLLADLAPDSLDRDDAETVLLVLLGVCVVGAVVVLRTVQKMATRMMLLGLLFLVGVGLWLQREDLEDCRDTCTCRVFGQDVRMPDAAPGLNCPEN